MCVQEYCKQKQSALFGYVYTYTYMYVLCRYGVCEHIYEVMYFGLQLGDTFTEDRIFQLLQKHCHTVDQLLSDRRHRLQDTLSYHQFCNQVNDLDLWIDDEVCTLCVMQ